VTAVPQLSAALQDKDKDVRNNAAAALGAIGAEARDAIPALVQALRYETVEPGPARALGKIGAAAVLPLCAALRDTDLHTRCGAAGALGDIGAGAKLAIPALTEALADKDACMRRMAVYSLGQIGTLAQKAEGALQAALKDQDREVRPKRSSSSCSTPWPLLRERYTDIATLLVVEKVELRAWKKGLGRSALLRQPVRFQVEVLERHDTPSAPFLIVCPSAAGPG
jgi:hypothetical protein